MSLDARAGYVNRSIGSDPIGVAIPLLCEKVQQGLVELGRFLDLPGVAALLQHHQLGPGNSIAKLFAAGQRKKFVL